MKASLANKLFAVVALTSSAAVILQLLLVHYSLSSGFAAYVSGMPPARAEELLEANHLFFTGQQRNFFFISAVVVGIASIAAYFLTRQLAEPLRQLMEGATRLAQGDFASRININTKDELGALAKDFDNLAESLSQQETAHKQWVADTSHELRTPVAILRAQVEAFQDGVQEVNPKTLAVLHQEVMSLGKLVNDLHDLARSDMGQLTYKLLPVDPASVVQDCLDAFSERFSEKQIEVRLEVEPSTDTVIEADAYRLKQLFNNLLENSYRYTNQNGKVQIRIFRSGERLCLDFDDSPPAVPENMLPRIFERFFRTESSRNRALGGSGLGLAISRGIVESHSGTIDASASELGGLKLSIRLPLRRTQIDG